MPADGVVGGATRAALPYAVALGLIFPLSVFGERMIVLLPGGFGLICLVLAVARRTRWRRPYLLPALPLLAVVAWGAASMVWSIAPELSVTRALRLVAGLASGWLFVIVAGQERAPADPRPVALVFLAGLALAVVLMLLQIASNGEALRVFGVDNPIWGPSMRVSQINPAETVLVVFCLPGALLAWRAFGTTAALAVLAVCAVVVFPSQSAASKLALAVALVAGAAVWRFGRAALKGLAGVLIALVLLLPASGMVFHKPIDSLRDRLAQIGVSLWPSAQHRAAIYDFTMSRIDERPWLGWGLGTSRALPGGQERIPGIGRERMPLHPHNAMLEIWVELGPVGGLSLCALIGAVILGIRRWAPDRRTAGAWAGAAAAYVTIGLVSYSLWSGWWIATAFLAAGIAAALFADRSPATA